MKRGLYIFFIGTLLISCRNDYAVEDELYKCLENEFSKHSLNLDKTLDTLELLYFKEGLIKSNKDFHYRQYYQTNIDTGMVLSLQDSYLKEIALIVQWSHLDLDSCVFNKFDNAEYEASKYGKITTMIDSIVNATGQISSSTVAKSHLYFLSAENFKHPYYRANILLSLQFNYFKKYVASESKHLRKIPKKI